MWLLTVALAMPVMGACEYAKGTHHYARCIADARAKGIPDEASVDTRVRQRAELCVAMRALAKARGVEATRVTFTEKGRQTTTCEDAK